jgi:hypothetical protein
MYNIMLMQKRQSLEQTYGFNEYYMYRKRTIHLLEVAGASRRLLPDTFGTVDRAVCIPI